MAGGFTTSEIREFGVRKGFRVTRAGAKLIEEIGAQGYLRQLIQNLRGE